MSSKSSSGDGNSSPHDILNNYLDDLLGDDPLGFALDALESQVAPLAANAGSARIVHLPTKKVETPPPVKSYLRSEIAPPKTAKPQVEIKESKLPATRVESLQTQEQKLKLEKLLQSARAQLLVDTPIIVPTETQPQTKTDVVFNPDEIQEWDIDITETVSVPEQQLIQTPTTSSFKLEGLEWLENGLPQWAQSRFDVLLFQVSGLTLAVPLIALGQIQPLTEELTPLFGQADWFMGLQPTPAGKIRTVNTAKFVMPERYDEAFLATAKYVVSINGVPWGLAVDTVNQPITLQPEDVKWRSDRSKRPWLAGTVKDHMCALLDIPRIGQMLIEADKNFIPA
ncbi:MAG TPA: chemotaxis protein CheW [Cellvibrio sp.]|nr:chemotaxis protein CheW [Cellvibrio sp.]